MKTKTFNSVKLMRKLRDQMSDEMAGMSPEERLRFIRERAARSPFVARLARVQRNAAPQGDATDDAPRRR